jgi:hypothetical protein
MSSSHKASQRDLDGRREALLVAEGGAAYAPSRSRDPLQAWVELMEVVEALCARWPERPRSFVRGSAGFRL